MYLYVKSEILKTKRTNIRKIIFIIPLLCSLLALGFNSLGGLDILKLSAETIVNHWGIIWVSVFIAIAGGLLNSLEKKGTSFKSIVGLPLNLKRKELSRVLLITGCMAIGSFFLIILLLLTSILIRTTPHLISVSSCILAIIYTFIVTLWQIPFCLWLSRKTNLFITLLFNTMCNLNLGSIFAPTEDWWMVPYSWHLRVVMPITKLHSNGIPLPQNDELLNDSVIPIALFISLLFFFILTSITMQSFKKLEVK
ncbi:lantibiotic immunity ABC transporter MutE/EpiE family permease subunit [Lysinibacillus sp. 3P01SB]|uniref:lantibiotic immunity ABC transporter MutE/EpiE family permease subunit n=1 Tax=Lysinibacillus sp. 3P01SB TaxID=3132284 RepID=UPI0039A52E8A